jgi:2OG-Fe dioxygenase
MDSIHTDCEPDENSQCLTNIWASLETCGYALIPDSAISSGAEQLRLHVVQSYFGKDCLETDLPEVHANRDRVRDVVLYEWNQDSLLLSEHDSVEIVARSGYAATRNPKRVRVLQDPLVATWISAVLHLVPPHQRYPCGTFGINFFRTRKTVVSGPHQDDEKICVVYVLDKVGSGAQTRLHPVDDPARIEYAVTLQPGDILLFQDSQFLHDVTPLTSEDGSACHRDVLVCTVDYTSTYGIDMPASNV